MSAARPAAFGSGIAQQLAWIGRATILASSLLIVAASVSAETTAEATKRIEAAPVNCATAQGDLRILAAERDHAEKHKLRGFMAISPAGILLGTVTGTQQKHFEMLTGDYILHIDQKMAEIRQACGL